MGGLGESENQHIHKFTPGGQLLISEEINLAVCIPHEG
jgi:hypothetical protein